MTITPDFVETPSLLDAVIALELALTDAINAAGEAWDSEELTHVAADEEFLIICEDITFTGSELRDHIHSYLAYINDQA